jgi:hypothetical protein
MELGCRTNNIGKRCITGMLFHLVPWFHGPKPRHEVCPTPDLVVAFLVKHTSYFCVISGKTIYITTVQLGLQSGAASPPKLPPVKEGREEILAETDARYD